RNGEGREGGTEASCRSSHGSVLCCPPHDVTLARSGRAADGYPAARPAGSGRRCGRCGSSGVRWVTIRLGETRDGRGEPWPTTSRDRKSTRLNSSHVKISY